MPLARKQDPRSRPPVDEALDLYRTARLNAKYYGIQLSRLQRWSLALDVAIAFGTSGTLAGLAIWQAVPVGTTLLLAIATVAAVLGVLKPILNLPKRAQRLTALWSGWTALFQAAHRLAVDVRVNGTVRDELVGLYETLMNRADQLSADDDPEPDRKLLDHLYVEVNDELPAESLWPAGDGVQRAALAT